MTLLIREKASLTVKAPMAVEPPITPKLIAPLGSLSVKVPSPALAAPLTLPKTIFPEAVVRVGVPAALRVREPAVVVILPVLVVMLPVRPSSRLPFDVNDRRAAVLPMLPDPVSLPPPVLTESVRVDVPSLLILAPRLMLPPFVFMARLPFRVTLPL